MIIITLCFMLVLLSFRDSALKLGLARMTMHHHCQLKIFSLISLQIVSIAFTEVWSFQHLHILYIDFLLLVIFLYSSPVKPSHVVTKFAFAGSSIAIHIHCSQKLQGGSLKLFCLNINQCRVS